MSDPSRVIDQRGSIQCMFRELRSLQSHPVNGTRMDSCSKYSRLWNKNDRYYLTWGQHLFRRRRRSDNLHTEEFGAHEPKEVDVLGYEAVTGALQDRDEDKSSDDSICVVG